MFEAAFLCTFEPVQAIQNLRWCIGSTPLLKSEAFGAGVVLDERWCAAQLRRHEDWLNDLALQKNVIAQAVDDPAAGRIPLGKRFERYLHFWFEHSPFFELKAANVQVNGDQFTIGEFDFIVEDLETSEVMHLEVACKFYLGVDNRRAQNRWVGPSGRDRLDMKTETLKRQLSLAEQPEGHATLNDLSIGKVTPRAFVKGYFFHHFTRLMQFKIPHGGHPKHNAGWWAYEREVDRLFAGDGTWIILPKSDWLAAVHLDVSDERLLSARRMPHACRDYIAANGRAVMVAQLDRVSGYWIEISRGCIVTNKWPKIG